MSKSADAFRTISEVAEWLDLPTHVLRFWESKFSQIKPVKRAGGRRYYRPRDMQLIGGLKTLLHDDGMTIRGAQKLLKENGVQHVIDLSPPLEAGLEAEIIPNEAVTEAPVEMVDMTADIETDAAQETKQVDDVQNSTTRPNLRLVETEDDDQFDLFADSPSENFWTDDDQTGAEAAAEPEAHADPDPAPLPDTRAGQLLNAAQRGTLSPAAIETLLTRVQGAIARRA
ncbi:MAG: MerR family transcriptional regulator [Rhodobacteraceae bacterium]|nr:MerR family transcriptional regulator [Paracoccaceae bacterium]